MLERMAHLSQEMRARVESLLGDRIVQVKPVVGGYTAAGRWRVELSSGGTAFVKAGASALTAEALRLEANVYRALQAPFMPELRAWQDHPQEPVLVLEDLGAADWPPPWDSTLVDEVRSALDAVHGSRAALPRSLELHGKMGGDWLAVANDPAPFLKLGLATAEWLERALPALLAASAQLVDEGDEVIHLDVRSDNLCRAARGVVLIDWNGACIGNGALDTGFWLPSLEAEGGPLPEVTLPHRPDVAACVSGFFAARAGCAPLADAPHVRGVQLQQLRPALLWVSRALELPRPF